MMDGSRNVTFVLGGMTFEYDEEKNKTNIKKAWDLLSQCRACLL